MRKFIGGLALGILFTIGVGYLINTSLNVTGDVVATGKGVFPDSLRTNGTFTVGNGCFVSFGKIIGGDSLRVNGPIISAKFNTLPDNTTPSVVGGDNWKCTPAGGTTITTFTGGTSGQVIRVVFTNTNATLSDAGTLKLSAAFTSTADDEMTLLYDGTNWYELSRSVN
jgi:hypothetical protein